MMKYVISAALIIAAIIHLLPLIGFLGADSISRLYGIAVEDSNLAILLRHRAVLFGILGAFLAIAAFKSAYQPMAFIAAFISVLTFLWLAWTTGGYNEAIQRVVVADLVALAALLIGFAVYLFQRYQNRTIAL